MDDWDQLKFDSVIMVVRKSVKRIPS